MTAEANSIPPDIQTSKVQGLTLLNFSHPLAVEHLAQIEQLTGQAVSRVIKVPVQVDINRSLTKQIIEIVDQVGFGPEHWKSLPIILSPPSYVPAAAVLLAEIAGRMRHLPVIVWLRHVAGSAPPRFEVADVISLQTVRKTARR